MKVLFALLVSLSFGATAQTSQSNSSRYSIEIYDQDYSMAYTVLYRVFDDSLTITGIAALVGEKDTCLVRKKIDKSQSDSIYNFLSSLDIMKLKSKYESSLVVNDGDRKFVTISCNGKRKEIEINNFYQKEMADLFEVVNKVVGAEFRIVYRDRERSLLAQMKGDSVEYIKVNKGYMQLKKANSNEVRFKFKGVALKKLLSESGFTYSVDHHLTTRSGFLLGWHFKFDDHWMINIYFERKDLDDSDNVYLNDLNLDLLLMKK